MLLSRTYQPSEALAPYIRRHYVFEAHLPSELVIEDYLLSETAFARFLLEGDWAGETAKGVWSRPGRALFFGANDMPFKVRVQGSFRVVGFAIRPSGWYALFNQSHVDVKDRLFRLQDVWGDLADRILEGIEAASDDAGIVAAMEAGIAQRIETLSTPEIDLQMAQFEVIARTDSTMRIDDVADQVGLSVRQLERRCRSTFGLTPKGVLRRSRFLDIAAAKRGFSTPSERDLAELRFFDQSHLNREFKRYTRMTPGQFERATTPLLTAGLKLREESRHED